MRSAVSGRQRLSGWAGFGLFRVRTVERVEIVGKAARDERPHAERIEELYLSNTKELTFEH